MKKETLVQELNNLIASGDLSIINPETGAVLCYRDIKRAVLNGPFVEITVSGQLPKSKTKIVVPMRV